MKQNYWARNNIILGAVLGVAIGWVLRRQYWLTRFGMSDAGIPR